MSQIAHALAERTDPGAAPGWDPVGLQLGDPDALVETAAVCHEVTEPVVSRLETERVDLLITYHPLIFRPTTRILAGRSAGARAFRLISAGVSVLVTHTDFDAAPGGSADALASFFGLRDVEPFGGDLASGLPQIGRFGSFGGTLGTVDAMLSDRFGAAGLRVSGDRDADLERMAVVPGSGSDLIEAAAELAQVLVTGDVSHHRAVAAADLGLAIVDPGHIATERPGMRSLVMMVTEILSSDVVDLTHFDPQTWS